MLEKIISGGQTGADQGGLEAGKEFGILTGGWMPKGFLTENGKCPELKEKFNLNEHSSEKYPPRTFTNARDSDGTIRFAVDFSSPGELCTLKAINQYSKPYIDIDVKDPIDIDLVVKWVNNNNIKTLNVAGNKESTYPGIQKFTREYLIKILNVTNGTI